MERTSQPIPLTPLTNGKVRITLSDHGDCRIHIRDKDAAPYSAGTQRAQAWDLIRRKMEGCTVREAHQILSEAEERIQGRRGRPLGWLAGVAGKGLVTLYPPTTLGTADSIAEPGAAKSDDQAVPPSIARSPQAERSGHSWSQLRDQVGRLIYPGWRTEELENAIEQVCDSLGYPYGWAWLYTHRDTLASQHWFITLQPGGTSGEHGVCAPSGMNYYVDRAGKKANRIATRMGQLYDTLDVDPYRTLTGVAVPFRSPSWSRWADGRSIPMSTREAAMSFGIQLWAAAVEQYQPQHIITFGKQATDMFVSLLGLGGSPSEVTSAEHGDYLIRRWRFHGGRVLAEFLHPSRFNIPLRKAKSWVEGGV